MVIKLGETDVTALIDKMKTSANQLSISGSEVNLTETNMITFKEYEEMFEVYKAALDNYKHIVIQDSEAMLGTVEAIVKHDRDIANQINKE
ncbi:DUF5344 family protein [Staphylococcus lutrae]|uniref:TIGR04197 family type VII secretion effector n=1 Tax=Staphylococcus lutrae TaxID=155085 RepID=A0AAC9RRI9_9STAP|nr:DUF5344 family protein [Staphylococcus lutrae]ARJ50998.1 hypothetical protein B5P37_06530 [Staphylococcus lutrae]PNZ37137.1 TIGR04197 family type VII secretion effector [Staphylococcus lutrae]